MSARFTKLQNVDLDDTTGTEGEEDGGERGEREDVEVKLILEDQPNGGLVCLKQKRGRWWAIKYRIKRSRLGRFCLVNSWRTVVFAFVVFFATVVLSLMVSRLASEPLQPFQLTKGAVATDVPLCSEMAADILRRNGSAVDATITALLCVGVVHAESSGIGGGGFMVVYDTNGSAHAINFRETAPDAATTDMYHSNRTLAEVGGLSVGVPGELRGMEVAHNMFGRLQWHELFEPVINMCRSGFPLTEHTEATLNETSQFFKDNELFRRVYFNENGEPKKAGDIVQRPKLADTLELIARNGTAEFYNGSIARSIVDEVHKGGGNLTLEDLAGYEARLEEPITIDYNGHTIYSTAAPSGGPLLLFILNTLETYPLLPANSTYNLTYHRLIEVFKYGFALRTQLGDPNCAKCEGVKELVLATQENMTSDSYAETIHQMILDQHTFNVPHYHAHFSTLTDHGTTHISVLAPDGQAVSVTSTVNTYFGSTLITDTGIVLNNEMDDFSSPNITNYFGVRPSETNFIKPGKRPLSSTCPIIVVKAERESTHPRLIIGGAGGTRIPTATAQAAIRVLSFKESLADAIEARRLHHQLTPNEVYYEDGYPEGILEFLHDEGHQVISTNSYAVVQGIHVDSTGNVTAHSDSRKQGQAVIT